MKDFLPPGGDAPAEGGKNGEKPIIRYHNGAPYYWKCRCRPGWRQLNIPKCGRCDMDRNCKVDGSELESKEKPAPTGIVECTGRGCDHRLSAGERFCSRCGKAAPARLQRANDGEGPSHDDENGPVDPAWPQAWKVPKMGRRVQFFFVERVPGAEGRPDGLAALCLLTVAPPDCWYRGPPYKPDGSSKGMYVPFYRVFAEVSEMRISKEVPLSHKINGVTPHPYLARDWDGTNKANKKMAHKEIEITRLIECWKRKVRVIMCFNIASWRAGQKSPFSYDMPDEWVGEGKTGGRLDTEIDQYFPPNTPVYSMHNERSWTDDEGGSNLLRPGGSGITKA